MQAASFQDPRTTDFEKQEAAARAAADERVHGEQPTIFQVAVQTIERNPLLALACVGVGAALVGMALSRKPTPQSRYRQMERSMRRQARALEKTLRDEARRAHLSDRFDALSDAVARGINSVDFSRFAWLQNAGADLYDKASKRLGSVIR